MKWTRYSLIYLASYLSITGVAFLAAPQRALAILQATGTYDSSFVRFVGAFMIALATLVIQMIRHRLEVLYTTTIAIRVMFVAVIIGLYADTRDPLFLMILGVVSLGLVLTTISHVVERHARRGAPSIR